MYDSNTPAPLGFHASYARLVADHVRAQDVGPRPVLDALGLPELAADSQADATPIWVPAQRLTQALHLAARLCRDPHVALHIGQQVRPANMGALGYMLISCEHLQDGLAMYERLQSLVCTQVRAEHRVKGEWLETALVPLGDIPRDTLLWTFTMTTRLAFARWVLGRHLVPAQLSLPCPAPADPQPLRDYVGGPVLFDAPVASERVPTSWLQLPNPHADPGLHRVMSAMTQRQWTKQSRSIDQLLGLLRHRIAQQLQAGELPLLDKLAPDVEEAMGLSPRQLQRRLAEQNQNFKDLVEEVRREQVLHELRDTQLPIVDIARRAAYAEVSSLHRAVRRWTGQTPLAVRQGSPLPDGHDGTGNSVSP
ncbi:MAG: AraC family transcriptional regulator [Burkholderiales bacterium]|nr:MAG: AraC family transcriptional regulator [Burkholderiales bacterium]